MANSTNGIDGNGGISKNPVLVVVQLSGGNDFMNRWFRTAIRSTTTSEKRSV